jgi:hypothetical protein
MDKIIQYQPYFKYLLFFIWIIVFAIVNSIFVRDKNLRKWILSSFEEQEGKASGKAITAFVLVHVVVIALLASILYSPNHIIPETMFDSTLIFISSLYSIKLIGKYGGRLGSFNGNDSSTSSDTSNNNQGINNNSTKQTE